MISRVPYYSNKSPSLDNNSCDALFNTDAWKSWSWKTYGQLELGVSQAFFSDGSLLVFSTKWEMLLLVSH